MGKKLPKLFKNDINKEIINNKNMVYVKNGDNINSNIGNDLEHDMENIKSKIDDIFNSNKHIFSIPVAIITKDKVYNTKIAGRMKNFLVTLDNDVINIDDIIDIKVTI